MPFPIRLDRDGDFISHAHELFVHATTHIANGLDDINVRSSGLLQIDHAMVKVNAALTITAGNLTGTGLHISSPPIHGEEFTPYSYNCTAWSEDPEIVPMLFIGVSPAVITNNNTGDVVTDIRFIKAGKSSGASMVTLEAEGTIATQHPFTTLGAGYETRAICFGVAFVCGLNNATAGSACYARISVRRLVQNEPQILDTSKLG